MSQQQNETQTGQTMSHTLPLPPVAEHQSGPGPGQIAGAYQVNESLTTVATTLGVPNNTVVSMATMTQPVNQLVSPGQQQNNQRPTYSPSYRGRPRGRRPSGSAGTGRGGLTGGVGEKRTAAAAGFKQGSMRPQRGTYRGNWPNRSPSKASPTGSNQSTVQGSSSQGMQEQLLFELWQ